MKKISVLIIDDDHLSRRRIRQLLEKEPDMEVMEDLNDYSEAVSIIKRHKPDLIFLNTDIYGWDGFNLLKSIDNTCPPYIIFVLTYGHHTLQILEMNSLDYLLKPFDRERFNKVVSGVREKILNHKNGSSGSHIKNLIDELNRKQRYFRRLLINNAGKLYFIQTGEIRRIEDAGNSLLIHIEKETHPFQDSLDHLEEKLDPASFIRINPRNIVNMECIKEIRRRLRGDHEIILRNGVRLPLKRQLLGMLLKIYKR